MSEVCQALIIDDEPGVRFFLEETLKRAGHQVLTAASGEAALELMRDARFDLAILDLNLGTRIDGLRVLEAIRWRWPDMVVIILTGHGSLDSAMAAIREGVDGYLLKPVEPAEVLQAVQEAFARRRDLLRGDSNIEATVLVYGPFAANLERHQASVNGHSLDLTPGEFDLLVYLMQHADRVVPPQELVRVTQGYEPDHLYEARQVIKWYIHRLRAKVEPSPAHPRYVLNVRGVGYTLARPEQLQNPFES
jgi:DNA-binding response OmpR family regulator